MGAVIGSWGAGQAPQILQPGVLTTIFDFTDSSQLKEMRIYIVNKGANPLSGAILEASNDGGETWVAVDQVNVTSVFGNLAGSNSVGNIFESNLFYDRIRFRLVSTLGTTIGKFITQNDIDI